MYQTKLKIGLFGIGLEAYWKQFEGLKERLLVQLATIHQKLHAIHPHIVNEGLVDTVDGAFQAGMRFRSENVDIIFLYVSTYALSSTVIPVVQRARVPVVILNLSPADAIDYRVFNQLPSRTRMTGEWLAYCSACPVPELANVFSRLGVQFHQVSGVIDGDEECWTEIREWVEAARVVHTMSFNRMGCMGHYYSGMLDIYTDLTLQAKFLGGHFEMIETDELSALRKEVGLQDCAERARYFGEIFDISPECTSEELSETARTSLALDRLVERYQLGSMAYYYKGTGNADNEITMSTVILGNSLLTGRGIPVAGEYEIKNCQAMKILDSFGAGGSFTEFYAMDYREDLVLMGHDGPGHMAIAEGRIRVKPLEEYHGKVGRGLSVEMSVKHGPVTLLSVVEKAGRLMLLVAEAASQPGAILEIGNTNSRYRFPIGARAFVNQWNSHGPAHHCAVGIGHIANKIEKLGKLLDLEVIRVC